MKQIIKQKYAIRFCVILIINKLATGRLPILHEVYGKDCLSKIQTFRWHKTFKGGRDVDDVSMSKNMLDVCQVLEFKTMSLNVGLFGPLTLVWVSERLRRCWDLQNQLYIKLSWKKFERLKFPTSGFFKLIQFLAEHKIATLFNDRTASICHHLDFFYKLV